MTDPVATTFIITIGGVVTALIGAVFKKLSEVGEKVDGRFTEQRQIFNERIAALERIIMAYQTEIIRLQQKDATTPYGTPSETNPVTLTAGVPTTELPP